MQRSRVIGALVVASLFLAACEQPQQAPGPAETSDSRPPAPTASGPVGTVDLSASLEPAAGGPTTTAAATSVVGLSTSVTSRGTSGTAAPPAGPVGGAGGDLVIFTWWNAGSMLDGLNALVRLFAAQYPNDTLVNHSVGNGSNAVAKLDSDLAHHEPPDTFQGQVGGGLTEYIAKQQIQPVDGIIAGLGGSAVFPQGLLDRMTVDGHLYSVPVYARRTNLVWANPQVIRDAGLDPVTPPVDITAWIADLERIKASGIETPLAIGGRWTQVQLWENVLLADLGADGYSGLFDGSTDWAGSGVSAAIADFATLMTFTNTSADDDDWPGAVDAVADGTAAYTVQTDWALSELNYQKKVAGTDYVYLPTPGTSGSFAFLVESFTLPTRAQNEGSAKDWLNLLGSAQGQKAFSLASGTIPVRSDTVASDYPAYQQTAIASWTKDTIVASIADGSAVSRAWRSDIVSAISTFRADKDQAELQAALAAAARKHLG